MKRAIMVLRRVLRYGLLCLSLGVIMAWVSPCRDNALSRDPLASEFLPEQVERDVVYERVGDRELHLDFYRPPTQSKLPLVVWVHGGG